VWIVAVAATGTGNSADPLKKFFAAVGRWAALQNVLGMLVESDDEVAHSVLSNPHQEVLRRIAAVGIRFSWVSKLILDSAAEEIERDQTRFDALSWFTKDVVGAYFKFAPSAVTKKSRRVWRRATVGSDLRRLLGGVSISAGSLAHLSFRDLILERRIESHPLVSFDGGTPVPVALRESTLGIETAFFEHVGAVVGGTTKGELFERALRRALSIVAPPSSSILPHSASIGPIRGDVNPQDKGETDFMGCDELAHASVQPEQQLIVIGEAKSHFVSQAATTVINAFEQEVGKAAEQADLRVERLRASRHFTTPLGVQHVDVKARIVGLVVPFHSYASAIYQVDSLELVGAHRVATIPIHELLIVLRAMKDWQDFRRYLTVRKNALRLRLIFWDEVDLLVNYLRDWDPATVQIPQEIAGLSGRVPAVRPLSIAPEKLLQVSLPTASRISDWRDYLTREAKYVDTYKD
jgi:hypothetical protein